MESSTKVVAAYESAERMTATEKQDAQRALLVKIVATIQRLADSFNTSKSVEPATAKALQKIVNQLVDESPRRGKVPTVTAKLAKRAKTKR